MFYSKESIETQIRNNRFHFQSGKFTMGGHVQLFHLRTLSGVCELDLNLVQEHLMHVPHAVTCWDLF